MAQVSPNATPAYKRIQGAILRRIEAGQLMPGDAVDSERELAKIHYVSLMTARHALAGLERERLGQASSRSWDFCGAAENPFQQARELY